MTDELEQDLRQALTIDPSPDFARHVRARIEARRGWFAFIPLRAGLAATAVAVCVLTAAAAWRAARTTEEVVVSPPARVAGADVRLGRAIPERALIPEALIPPPRLSRPSAAARRVQPVEPPEIIVSEDRARGLQRLLALARSGTVDEDMLRPMAATAARTLELAPISVPSIPLPDMDNQTGAPREGAGRQ
jgi:hypothetical protein